MISKELQAWGRQLANKIVAPLAASPLTPNMLTVIGLLLSLLTGVVIADGFINSGGILLLCAGVFDMFDGALARVTGKTSVFGAFFDSTLDRIAEAGTGLGLLLYYDTHHSAVGVTLLYVVIIGSLMVSYARARAEGLGLDCKVGFMARPERVIILGVALILGATVTLWALALLALATWLTVAQRIVYVWRATEQTVVRRTAPPEESDDSEAAHHSSLFKRKGASLP